MRQIYNLKRHHLGEIFVKYLEPINVNSFLASRTSIQSEAIQISSELYIR